MHFTSIQAPTKPFVILPLLLLFWFCLNDEHMIIKEWKKCLDIRKEVLGSNIKRNARIGDRIISILHNGESGAILFFAILP